MTNRDKINKMTNKEYAKMLLELSGDNRGCGNCCLSDKYCTTKMGDDCFTNIYNWLSQERELTADEMFEEMGYECFHIMFSEYYKDNIRIEIKQDKETGQYNWCKYNELGIIKIYTDKEMKAIYKKIEELKENKND